MQSMLAQRVTIQQDLAPTGDLVQIATPVIELILEIKARAEQPSSTLRDRMDGLLRNLEHDANVSGYRESAVRETKFALAAFADETVLSASFPLRSEWEKYPLQLEYFGEHLAGVTFYERLHELMKAPEENIEVLELYYVCLLLGFKGKYKVTNEEQLRVVVDDVTECMRRLGRLHNGILSPHWRVTDQPQLITSHAIPTWVKTSGVVTVALLLLSYLVLSFWLNSDLRVAIRELLR
jgi:type VI secretion system protein ImpK